MYNIIDIKGLFGTFDYEIKFKKNGVTILTGPNGFGKSTILRIIDAVYNADIMLFSRLDFTSIKFKKGNKILLRLEKKEDELYVNKIIVDLSFVGNSLLKRITRKPYYSRLDKELWIDRRDNEVYSSDDLIQKHFSNEYSYDISNPDNFFQSENYENIVKISDSMKEVSSLVRFIKEQRLITEKYNHRKDKEVVNTIDEMPNLFKNMMSTYSNQYSATANQLDSSYPNRLFATKKGITKKEYGNKMSSMIDRFNKLAIFDISDIRMPESVNFLEEHAKALKVYFEDFEKKYEVFNDLILQLGMFTDIVNSRLNFKEIAISREHGIIVFKNGDPEKTLSLSQLSSGEKQEIVLFYELIFNIDNNVHLLIDEPEISLHIEWQMKFMDDLLRVAKHKNLRVTVATHSPQIISDHWDIQIDLGELYGK